MYRTTLTELQTNNNYMYRLTRALRTIGGNGRAVDRWYQFGTFRVTRSG